MFKKQSSAVLPQVAGALAASLLELNAGCLMGLPSILIPQLEEETNENLNLNFSEGSWIASVYLISNVPACLIGGYLSTLFGRRMMIMLICLPLAGGWVLLATAETQGQLLIGRLVQALSLGLAQASSGAFISEVTHPDLRGSLGTVPSVFLAVGLTTIYSLGAFLPWRTACWALTAGPALLMASFLYLPESPYWLMHHGYIEKAKSSLQWYRGGKTDITQEFEEISPKKLCKQTTTTTAGKNSCASFGSCDSSNKCDSCSSTIAAVSCHRSMLRKLAAFVKTLTSKRFLRPYSISGVIYILAQLNGVSTIIVFMSSIFSQAGCNLDPQMAPIVVSVIRIIAATMSSVVMTMAPRKHIFCFSSFLITISTLSMAVSRMYLKASFIPMVAIVTMAVGHSLGIVPICQIVAGEVFPTEIRTLGTGFGSASANLANSLNAEVYSILLNFMGFSGTFFLYSGIGLLMTIYGFCTIPDTRSMSLVKIETELFGKNGEDTQKEKQENTDTKGGPC